MDKQKQIEEMAKLLDGYWSTKSKCPFDKNCPYLGGNVRFTCSDCLRATKLYNAGYRKADDLLKELQSMKSDFAKDMLEIKETYEKEVVDLVNEVRKQTAEKFAEKAKKAIINMKWARDDTHIKLVTQGNCLKAIDKIAKEIIGEKE